MAESRSGWSAVIRREGPAFLEWLAAEQVLDKKFDSLAKALKTQLWRSVSSADDADGVWTVVPDVLGHCNEPATYSKPMAAVAYAWLHMLDRYVRTWRALEAMVRAGCLPLAKDGVRALDIGTGPGPSAFAIHDFYAALTEFAAYSVKPSLQQPPALWCVEFDPASNLFRTRLAETLFQQSDQKSSGVLAMCFSMGDFQEVRPTEQRQHLRKMVLSQEDDHFDDERSEWIVAPWYTSDEANDIAQRLHRYRLMAFSNFLTSTGVLKSFEPSLVDLLGDSQPGTVLMVLGGRGEPYPEIYGYANELATKAGFQLKLAGEEVSARDSVLADRIYDEARDFYAYLQRLSPNTAVEVREHFEVKRKPLRSSALWVYRKYRRT